MAVKVIDLFDKHKDDLKNKYQNENKTIKELAQEYGCSNNTMMITIGLIGFDVEPWCTPYINKKIEYIEKRTANRNKIKSLVVK